ncbi:MAG TPA: hypothetical protein DCZ94_20420 [Lentisphaeria bacterium]|nr:MAG: hypothetical protein A2X48_15200 [Lentisphaerae bacterium GWF2_49_21]HBC89313.1 hypothetical protein [Lentisphaeria bacterium]
MASEFCPSCRELRNMQVSISEIPCKEGIIFVRSYHCEKCRRFVKSEESKLHGLGKNSGKFRIRTRNKNK